jgi:hypothetical protein
MKKLIINLIIFLTFSLIANAQNPKWRNIDIKANIISPNTGDYIVSPTTVKTIYSIANLGPDTVWSLDSFHVSIAHLNDSQSEVLIIPVNIMLVPGDSIIYEHIRDIDLDVDHNAYRISVVGRLYNRSPNYPFFWETTDLPIAKNNQSQVFLKHRSATSSINKNEFNKQEITVWPNPASQIVHVKTTFSLNEQCTLMIQDMTGKKVMHQQFSSEMKDNKERSVDISDLANGVYNIIINHPEGRYTKKLMVRNDG